MSEFDSMYNQLQSLYDAAVKKLTELDAEKKKVQETVEKLGPLFQNKKYSVEVLKAAEPRRALRGRKSVAEKAEKEEAPKKRAARGAKKEAVREAKAGKVERSKRRIKKQSVLDSVVTFLSAATPETRTGVEILDHLTKDEGYPATNSFRTRVYTLLGAWSSDPSNPVVKIGRGVYGLTGK